MFNAIAKKAIKKSIKKKVTQNKETTKVSVSLIKELMNNPDLFELNAKVKDGQIIVVIKKQSEVSE